MHTLKLTDQQLDMVAGALEIAQRYCSQLADQAQDGPIRRATRGVASQYGALRRQLKDGQLAALVHQEPSPAPAVRTCRTASEGEASSRAPT